MDPTNRPSGEHPYHKWIFAEHEIHATTEVSKYRFYRVEGGVKTFLSQQSRNEKTDLRRMFYEHDSLTPATSRPHDIAWEWIQVKEDSPSEMAITAKRITLLYANETLKGYEINHKHCATKKNHEESEIRILNLHNRNVILDAEFAKVLQDCVPLVNPDGSIQFIWVSRRDVVVDEWGDAQHNIQLLSFLGRKFCRFFQKEKNTVSLTELTPFTPEMREVIMRSMAIVDEVNNISFVRFEPAKEEIKQKWFTEGKEVRIVQTRNRLDYVILSPGHEPIRHLFPSDNSKTLEEGMRILRSLVCIPIYANNKLTFIHGNDFTRNLRRSPTPFDFHGRKIYFFPELRLWEIQKADCPLEYVSYKHKTPIEVLLDNWNEFYIKKFSYDISRKVNELILGRKPQSSMFDANKSFDETHWTLTLIGVKQLLPKNHAELIIEGIEHNHVPFKLALHALGEEKEKSKEKKAKVRVHRTDAVALCRLCNRKSTETWIRPAEKIRELIQREKGREISFALLSNGKSGEPMNCMTYLTNYIFNPFNIYPTWNTSCFNSYFVENYTEQWNIAEKIDSYEKNAKNGESRAQFKLGACYGNGAGVTRDLKRSAYFYQKAAKKGHAQALYILGYYYSNGIGVVRDPVRAAALFEQGAKQGNIPSQFALGVCFENGLGVVRDFGCAVAFYQKAANQGLAMAQYHLAVCYTNEGRNLARAAALYRQAANQDLAQAQFALGVCYEYGRGVVKDPVHAAVRYQQAADQGFAQARFALGVCYENGIGVARNPGRAAELYQQATDQSYVWAQFALGVCYEYGRGVPRNPVYATVLYQLAADQGLAEAQFALGVCLENGRGAVRNIGQAAAFYQDAATQGYAPAQLALGVCYENGGGVTRDPIRAATLYQQASDQDNAQAKFNLGRCYANGIGVGRDLVRAAALYQQAADQGLASAQFILGFCYENGIGVARDLGRAVARYQQAANQGHAQAQCNLGTCHAKGIGVPIDHRLAVDFYQLATNQGFGLAQYNLGFYYEHGIVVSKNPERAAALYQQAADQGYACAQLSLGDCYANEIGVPKDPGRAAILYQLAADLGHAHAQCSLGACYANGIGVLKNPVRAVALYQQAADKGDPVAKLCLGKCFESGMGVAIDRIRAHALYKQAADQGWPLERLQEISQGMVKEAYFSRSAAAWALLHPIPLISPSIGLPNSTGDTHASWLNASFLALTLMPSLKERIISDQINLNLSEHLQKIIGGLNHAIENTLKRQQELKREAEKLGYSDPMRKILEDLASKGTKETYQKALKLEEKTLNSHNELRARIKKLVESQDMDAARKLAHKELYDYLSVKEKEAGRQQNPQEKFLLPALEALGIVFGMETTHTSAKQHTKSIEIVRSLFVSIPEKMAKESLQYNDLLKHRLNEEIYDSCNCWRPRSAVAIPDYRVTCRFLEIPNILIVNLDQNRRNHREIQQIEATLRISKEEFLTKQAATKVFEPNVCYQLRAFVLQEGGNSGGGHYTAIVRGVDNQWRKYNDNIPVEILSEKQWKQLAAKSYSHYWEQEKKQGE